jgi:hypothetical protein
MSLMHVGAYSWSWGQPATSNSTCEATAVSDVLVHVSGSECFNCSALSMTSGKYSNGANAYGGSMSLMHVGAYSWSFSEGFTSSSTCEKTAVSEVSVHVSGSACSNCSALSMTNTTSSSNGVNSYGGSMSLMHVGAYSWSLSNGAASNSTCRATAVSDVSVHVSSSECFNCSALSLTSASASHAVNSYGGSMSLMHVGAYSWSLSVFFMSNSNSTCGATAVSEVLVHVSGSACSNCSALSSISGRTSYGANSYGGAISAAAFGAYAYSFSFGSFNFASRAIVNITQVSCLTVMISTTTFRDVTALSGELC